MRPLRTARPRSGYGATCPSRSVPGGSLSCIARAGASRVCSGGWNARRAAQQGGHQISGATLVAADRVILVPSLPPEAFATADILALYRLRWRIELAFK